VSSAKLVYPWDYSGLDFNIPNEMFLPFYRLRGFEIQTFSKGREIPVSPHSDFTTKHVVKTRMKKNQRSNIALALIVV